MDGVAHIEYLDSLPRDSAAVRQDLNHAKEWLEKHYL
jgi:hypothetical protein